MSSAATTRTAPRGDSLLTGMASMLVLNVMQRGVGFIRGLLFCRFLLDEELGQFSLANSFVLLAAPLVVLGLPGSFGRYVEYYRQRGQLRSFMSRMSALTLVLTAAGTALMFAFEAPLAELLLGDRTQTRLVSYSLATLALVVGFNFCTELLTALRQVRAVSWMQFANSVAFTILGLGLVFLWEPTAEAVVLAFGLSSAAGIAAALPWWGELKAEFQSDRRPLELSDVWTRLLPFAGWMWLTNLIVNLGDFVDRGLIMHASGEDIHQAQALVGQYHSSRVVPLLFATLAMTVASVLLPHLSRAWEAGRRGEVSALVNLSMKLLSLGFTLGGMLVLWTSPWLFGWLLGGKYDAGLAALPWAMTGCLWFGILVVQQSYLWCAERAPLAAAAFALSAGVNLVLTWIALPWGLEAIMAARGLSTLAAIVATALFCRPLGLQVARGAILAMLLPLALVCGPLLGTALLLALVVFDWRFKCYFDDAEESQVREALGKIGSKLGWRT